MPPLNIVLLQSDPRTMQSLHAQLGSHFRSVREARSFGDMRDSIASRNAEIVILDIEIAPLTEVQRLSHDFPEVQIVCNHRLADDQMWTAALNAGAADCCVSSDPRSILEAAQRSAGHSHSKAA